MSFRNLINAFFFSKLFNPDKMKSDDDTIQLISSVTVDEDIIDVKLPKELRKINGFILPMILGNCKKAKFFEAIQIIFTKKIF